jgi:transcriptional regulator with XRE-family HTH domain
MINARHKGEEASHQADPMDLHVGWRLKMRRTILGLSQEKLAEKLGITFQQVQKYERGQNRISASRLYHLSQLLQVEISYFFQDHDLASQDFPVGPLQAAGTSAGLNVAEEIKIIEDPETWRSQESLELLRHYYSNPDKSVRRQVLDLVKTMAKRPKA